MSTEFDCITEFDYSTEFGFDHVCSFITISITFTSLLDFEVLETNVIIVLYLHNY